MVKSDGPITGEQIADRLSLARATLRPDMAILTMSGFLEARPRVGYFYSGKSPSHLLGEKLHKIKVAEIKSVPVVVAEQCTVYDAVVAMFIEDVGTLFVVREQGFLEGVLSRKDLLKITLGGHDIQKLPVGVAMTRMPNLVTVDAEESVWTAAQKIIMHEINTLPVVRAVGGNGGTGKAGNGKNFKGYEVLGRISKTNITRMFVELGEGN